MSYPFDSNLEGRYNGAPQCIICAEDLSSEEILTDKELQDGLCSDCRAVREEDIEL